MDDTSRTLWTPEQLLKVRTLTDPQISPDGNHVAFTVKNSYKERDKSPESHVWLASTAGTEARQFTSGQGADTSPRWSLDGNTLVFLSDREKDGRFAIYTIPCTGPRGGEAVRLVELKGSASAPAWSPVGAKLAFLMTDPETDEERERKEKHEDAIEFERNPKYQRLYVVNADGSELHAIECGDVQIWEYEWLPDGSGFAAVCSALPYEWSWYEAYLATIPSGGGEARCIYKDNKQVANPVPSPDSKHVAFTSANWSDRGVVGGEVMVVPANGGDTISLTSDYPASFSWLAWNGAESLLALGYEDGKGAMFRIGLSGQPERLWTDEVAFADRACIRASISRDGNALAVIREDHSSPPNVWVVDLSAIEKPSNPLWKQVTRLQEDLRELPNGDAETLRWRGEDGLPIQGILLKPAGYREGTRYPLVTLVHGGPTGLYHHSFITTYSWTPLLVSQGFAVLLPNPRGSTGWGTEYAEANLEDMGGRDLRDILLGIDAAIERGIADPKRLGIGGGSYGGFMSAWAVTQTDRFKAAVMFAGIANWRSFHGVTNISTWDRLYYRDDPYRQGSRFDQFSPALHSEKVRTPTLIVHGEADPCVPVGQGYEFFRALRENGIETRLLVYPREGHGLSERAHILQNHQRVMDWFESHLKGANYGEH